MAGSMRTFLTTIFFLALLVAVISLVGLVAYEPTRADVFLAVGSTLVAVALYMARHAYLVRFGRLGLLKPTLFWKPMTPKSKKAAVAASAAASITTIMSHQQKLGASGGVEPDSVAWLVHTEMRKSKALGYDRKLRSDEELISENKLIRFVETFREDRSAPPVEELRGVRDRAVFFDLRQKVDDWYARKAERQTEYQAWLAEVGDPNRDHLLDNGWIAFLESLDGPDIHLWHGIATDMHDIEDRDRLDAAFWILGQPDCDKATASAFIVAFSGYSLDCEPAERQIARLAEVIERYNAGFYAFHSLRADRLSGGADTDAQVAEILAQIETRRALPPLPRPVGLLNDTVAPSDPADRGYFSGYAFWDDAGLHLSYPGDGWQKSA